MRRLALSAGAVLTLAISVLTTAVSQQSPQSSSDSQPTFKATTRIVNVNLVVTDSHGNPITGLAKDDFELFDRGQPQTIRFFEAIDNVAPPPAEPLPPDTYTNQPPTKRAPPSVTALLVDVQHTDWPAQVYSLYHLRVLLRKLHPDDRIAIYLFTDTQFKLLHDFTQDSSDVIAAIQRYDAQHSASQVQGAKLDRSDMSDLDRLLAGSNSKLSFSQWQAATGINVVPCEGGALQGTADPSAYRPRPPTVHLATVLPDIARHLALASGRKSLIWIFGGTFRKLDALSEFMSPSDFGLQDLLIRRFLGRSGSWTSQPRNQGLKAFLLGSNPSRNSRNPALRDRALQEIRAGLYSGDLVPLLVRLFNDNGIAVYPVGAEGLQTGGIADAGPEDLDFKDPCAAQRDSRYGVLAPTPDTAGEDMHGHMMEIAKRTGGRAFYNRNDLETGIERALDDGHYSYEIAYYPDHNDWTGEWRKIEVKLKDPEKYGQPPSGLAQEVKNVLVGGYGVHVLARGGYFALPEPRLAPTPLFDRRVLSKLLNSPSDATELPFLVRAVPLPDKENPQIQLLLNLDAENLLVPQEGNHWRGNFELSFIQVVHGSPSNCCPLLTRSTPTLRNRSVVPPLHTRAEVRERSQVPAKSYVLDLNAAEYQKAIEKGMASTRTMKLQPDASMLVVVLHDKISGAVGSLHIPLAQYTSTLQQ